MVTQEDIYKFGRISVLAMLRHYGVVITTPLPLCVLRQMLSLAIQKDAYEEESQDIRV